MSPANDICACRHCDVQAEAIQRLKGCHSLLFVTNNINPANDATPNEGNVVVTYSASKKVLKSFKNVWKCLEN
jgi:hypothetical protein